MQDAKATLNALLVDLFRNILSLEEQNLKKKGVPLSMNEVHILESIERSETKTMSSVAHLQKVTLGTMTVGIKTLETKGYVVRSKDEYDKRIVRLSLTEKAEFVIEAHHQYHEGLIDALVHDLQLDQEEALMAALQRVVAYFEKQSN